MHKKQRRQYSQFYLRDECHKRQTLSLKLEIYFRAWPALKAQGSSCRIKYPTLIFRLRNKRHLQGKNMVYVKDLLAETSLQENALQQSPWLLNAQTDLLLDQLHVQINLKVRWRKSLFLSVLLNQKLQCDYMVTVCILQKAYLSLER